MSMGGRTPGGVGAAEINKLIGGFGHLMLKYTNLYVKKARLRRYSRKRI
jgi:hypothetical protein